MGRHRVWARLDHVTGGRQRPPKHETDERQLEHEPDDEHEATDAPALPKPEHDPAAKLAHGRRLSRSREPRLNVETPAGRCGSATPFSMRRPRHRVEGIFERAVVVEREAMLEGRARRCTR
jgi:hypothetical protein